MIMHCEPHEVLPRSIEVNHDGHDRHCNHRMRIEAIEAGLLVLKKLISAMTKLERFGGLTSFAGTSTPHQSTFGPISHSTNVQCPNVKLIEKTVLTANDKKYPPKNRTWRYRPLQKTFDHGKTYSVC